MLARLQRESLAAATAGLVVWALHFVVVYSLFSIGCDQGWDAAGTAGFSRLALLLLLMSLPFLVLLVWMLVGSLVHWRRNRAPAEGGDPAAERGRFLAMTAFWLNLVALVATIWVSSALVLTTPC